MDGKRFSSFALIAALLGFAALHPVTAEAATATATGTVTAGTLSLTTAATPAFSVTLDGTDKTPTYTVPSTAEDATGSGAGWNLTITSTPFSTGGGTPRTLSTSASTITGVTNVCATTCTAASNATAYPVSVPAAATPPTAVKYYNAAADTGMGRFTNTPTVAVSVPANAYAGTYTSTLTIAAVSGP